MAQRQVWYSYRKRKKNPSEKQALLRWALPVLSTKISGSSVLLNHFLTVCAQTRLDGYRGSEKNGQKMKKVVDKARSFWYYIRVLLRQVRKNARVAQLVERDLAKVEAAGSSPVSRFFYFQKSDFYKK